MQFLREESARREYALRREILGPDWMEAHIALLDALRDFIKIDKDAADECLRDGSFTRKQYEKVLAEHRHLRKLLKRFEDFEPDPSLLGTFQMKHPFR
jgi:hypothetical protein